MLKTYVVVAVAAAASIGAAEAVIKLSQAPAQAAPMAAVASVDRATMTPAVASGPQAAQILKAADGHYWAEAKVNGSRVRFLVDTGATAVALSPDDAKRLGFDLSTLKYGYKVTTASGEARAAKVSLKSVSVAGARIDDVEAYVIENGLETSLLGMTYLGRLSRFEATKTALILRP